MSSSTGTSDRPSPDIERTLAAQARPRGRLRGNLTVAGLVENGLQLAATAQQAHRPGREIAASVMRWRGCGGSGPALPVTL